MHAHRTFSHNNTSLKNTFNLNLQYKSMLLLTHLNDLRVYVLRSIKNVYCCKFFILLFSENEVDALALKLLDDAQVRALIPAIGPQAKFKKVLSEWKVSLEKVI